MKNNFAEFYADLKANAALTKLNPDFDWVLPEILVRDLVGYIKQAQRYATTLCNRPVSDLEQAAALRCNQRIQAFADWLGIPVELSGDPRGPVVRFAPDQSLGIWGGGFAYSEWSN